MARSQGNAAAHIFTPQPDAEEVFALRLQAGRGAGKGFEMAAKPPPENLATIPDTHSPRDRRPLGQILIESAAVDPADLLKAMIIRRREQKRLGEVLLSRGWISEAKLMRALCLQWRTTQVDLAASPPDARLLDQLGAARCLANSIVPWRRIGNVTFIATSRPEEFHALRDTLPDSFGTVRMLLATEAQIEHAVLALRSITMLHEAETSVALNQSARQRSNMRVWAIAAIVTVGIFAGLLNAPVLTAGGLTLLATLIMMGNMGLRFAAFMAVLRLRKQTAEDPQEPLPMPDQLPVISVMVPMFHEADIAPRLVARLTRLNYPRSLTDILLVVEESDMMTRKALSAAALPRWMRVITVPDGPVRTKPRALNYALNFCRGNIIGIWDAEDQPEPDQLLKIAHGFAHAPADVACLQGVLDFYNPRTNWLARCFTIEYATHFRGVLPGIAALGLVVPLGGTTIFCRRDLLEKVGAWDAWNVTEDADLGVRFARHGLRTEMIDTVTYEEANCRTIPWIKQRSRWLKGFFMTWSVHMRQPLQLYRQIGLLPFLAFQIQMFFCVAGFLLAPLLWTCWLMMFGVPHPVAPTLALMGGWGIAGLIALFLLSETLSIAVGLYTTRAAERRHLMRWVPTCYFYFPLGCFAGWKAIYEVLRKPFYWDKTTHGVFDASPDSSEEPNPALSMAKLRHLIELQSGPPSPEAAALVATAINQATAKPARKKAVNETHHQPAQPPPDQQPAVEVLGSIT